MFFALCQCVEQRGKLGFLRRQPQRLAEASPRLKGAPPPPIRPRIMTSPVSGPRTAAKAGFGSSAAQASSSRDCSALASASIVRRRSGLLVSAFCGRVIVKPPNVY
jgi:hypothetical protein